jgi:hypothetical protein
VGHSWDTSLKSFSSRTALGLLCQGGTWTGVVVVVVASGVVVVGVAAASGVVVVVWGWGG